MFEEWKENVGGFTCECITRQTYEDLQWMIFSVVGVACKYLDKDKSKKINQKRSGTDVCEHFFAKVRQTNPCPTLMQCREITSKISGLNITHNHMFGFESGSNTSGVKRTHEEYLEFVVSKSKLKKRKTY